MIITPIQFDVPSLITGPADQLATGRSAGLHLSQIYRDLDDSYQSTVKKGSDISFSEQELRVYRAGGFMWERVFSQAMAEAFRSGTIIRPGEFCVDGITGSPDNLRVEPAYRVVETKCTWRSINKMEMMDKFFWLWLVQMKGYCKMVGTQEVELYAYFLNGNYAPPVPQVRASLITFSKMEIGENWGMIKAHARRRGWIK